MQNILQNDQISVMHQRKQILGIHNADYGINGIGKSLLAELVLFIHDHNIIHLHTDDDRGREYITSMIKPILRAKKTFDGQENALLVSDIDSSTADYGFITTLVECIKETQIPIICITIY